MTLKWRSVWKYSFLSSLIIGLLYSWLMTLQGLHVTLHGLSYFISGNLSIERVEGSLLGLINLNQLSYQSKGLKINLEKFLIDFKKRDLLKGKLTIKDLRIEKLNLQSEATDGSSTDVSSLLERVSIQHAQLKECQLKTTDGYLMIDGAIAPNALLNLKLEGHGLNLTGQLKTHAGEKPSMELIAHSTSCVLWDKKIPALAITAQYQNAKLSSHVTTIDPEKPINEISLTVSKIRPKSFLRQPLVELVLNARCKDFSILELVGFSLKDYPFAQSSGPMTVDFSCQNTLKYLKRVFKNTTDSDSLRKYFERELPKRAELSVKWQDPYLVPWGIFERFTIEGQLHKQHIFWDAKLTEALKPNEEGTQAKWQIVGKTQFVYKRANATPRLFPRQKSLQAKTHLELKGDALTLFTNTNYALSALPKIDITAYNQNIHLSGEVFIPAAHFKLTDPPFTIKPDSDIYFVQSDIKASVNTLMLNAQLALKLGKNVYLDYGGLNARLGGALSLGKKDGRSITAKGEIKIIEGGYYSFGQTLKLAKNARLIFTERLSNPSLDIEASRTVEIKPSNRLLPSPCLEEATPENVESSMYSTNDLKLPLKAEIGVHLRGDLTNPSMHLFAKPASWIMDPKDHLSYLMTGQPLSHLGNNPLSLLLNTASRLTHGYIHYHNVLYDVQPLGAAINQELEEGLRSHRLVFSYQYTPEFALLWKIKRSGTALGVFGRIGEHLTIGGSLGYKTAHGCDIGYQYEWG